jgi:hypothetical protein
MNSTAYAPSPKPLECYLADAAWDNFILSLWSSPVIFLSLNIFLPMLIKASAKGITALGKLDSEANPIASRIGHILIFLTDADGDGKTTPGDMFAPQLFVGIIAISLPPYYFMIYNDQKARCDYANSLRPAK